MRLNLKEQQLLLLQQVSIRISAYIFFLLEFHVLLLSQILLLVQDRAYFHDKSVGTPDSPLSLCRYLVRNRFRAGPPPTPPPRLPRAASTMLMAFWLMSPDLGASSSLLPSPELCPDLSRGGVADAGGVTGVGVPTAESELEWRSLRMRDSGQDRSSGCI